MFSTFKPKDVIDYLRDFGWTMAGIAEAVGVTQSTVSRIYCGRQRPSYSTANKLLELAESEASKISAMRERLVTLIASRG